jgi:hypothetical protein
VLEMLLGLCGHVANPLFLLESGDELSGDSHRMTTVDSVINIILALDDRQADAEPTRSLLIPWRLAC